MASEQSKKVVTEHNDVHELLNHVKHTLEFARATAHTFGSDAYHLYCKKAKDRQRLNPQVDKLTQQHQRIAEGSKEVLTSSFLKRPK